LSRASDTGIGIAEDDVDKIVEPLFSTRGFGVGLGLPTAKRVAEQHGGGLEIRSELGKGTMVTIWLPISKH
jgi:signal transduction histidine kinase